MLVFSQLSFCDSYFAQAHSTSLTDWWQTTVDDGSESSLPAAHTNREVSHTGSVAPDMVEGRLCEVASPHKCDA